jgi:hypothetical protein
MAVFIVTTTYQQVEALLKARITELFPTDHYEIGGGKWLVAFDGTAKGLYSKLSNDEPASNHRYFMFGVSGYYGLAPLDMWEWLANKLEGENAK